MADLCQQCSIDTWGEDNRDLAELTLGSDTTLVLCEGCGYVLVDFEGKCVDDGCHIHGKSLRTNIK